MKSLFSEVAEVKILVTLRVRVWIEIFRCRHCSYTVCVTLRVRVWIEMLFLAAAIVPCSGHPPCEGVD